MFIPFLLYSLLLVSVNKNAFAQEDNSEKTTRRRFLKFMGAVTFCEVVRSCKMMQTSMRNIDESFFYSFLHILVKTAEGSSHCHGQVLENRQSIILDSHCFPFLDDPIKFIRIRGLGWEKKINPKIIRLPDFLERRKFLNCYNKGLGKSLGLAFSREFAAIEHIVNQSDIALLYLQNPLPSEISPLKLFDRRLENQLPIENLYYIMLRSDLRDIQIIPFEFGRHIDNKFYNPSFEMKPKGELCHSYSGGGLFYVQNKVPKLIGTLTLGSELSFSLSNLKQCTNPNNDSSLAFFL